MTKDPATLMVGQYFKRRRNVVEIVLVSSTGLGLCSMSAFLMISVGYAYYVNSSRISHLKTVIHFSAQSGGVWASKQRLV